MSKLQKLVVSFTIAVCIGAGFAVSSALAQGPPPGLAPDKAPAGEVTVEGDASVHLPPLVVPFSNFASPESKAAFLEFIEFYTTKSPMERSVAEQRQMEREHYAPVIERAKALYPVDIVAATIEGVHADIVTPKSGIAGKNKNRVLINLHGGGFMTGAGIFSQLESNPVAALGRIKVVTVDYRQGPEYKFPAASEDVGLVYKGLLKTYKPRNIGIYGCSAGAC